ncbi:MAG: hypothetical protein A2888_01500 [Chlamydiae bacterium RIFCSPLOWO2_01_FULL_28_7]|nr:MAG: hypothetical protein A2888_01500 [Chlamydiae bacterium RIFCSPLOWO2_01_FULL_28_7]
MAIADKGDVIKTLKQDPIFMDFLENRKRFIDKHNPTPNLTAATRLALDVFQNIVSPELSIVQHTLESSIEVGRMVECISSVVKTGAANVDEATGKTVKQLKVYEELFCDTIEGLHTIQGGAQVIELSARIVEATCNLLFTNLDVFVKGTEEMRDFLAESVSSSIVSIGKVAKDILETSLIASEKAFYDAAQSLKVGDFEDKSRAQTFECFSHWAGVAAEALKVPPKAIPTLTAHYSKEEISKAIYEIKKIKPDLIFPLTPSVPVTKTKESPITGPVVVGTEVVAIVGITKAIGDGVIFAGVKATGEIVAGYTVPLTAAGITAGTAAAAAVIGVFSLFEEWYNKGKYPYKEVKQLSQSDENSAVQSIFAQVNISAIKKPGLENSLRASIRNLHRINQEVRNAENFLKRNEARNFIASGFASFFNKKNGVKPAKERLKNILKERNDESENLRNIINEIFVAA